MAKGTLWNAARLKSRGWTNRMMKDLLPHPRIVNRGGHFARLWDKEDVLRAEQSPQFSAENTTGRQNKQAAAVFASAAEQAAAALTRAWEQADRDENSPWLLAGHYHRAILTGLPVLARGRGLRMSQISSWTGEFLALERRGDPKQVPGILKNFVKAAAWIGEEPTAEPVKKVCAGYPQILYAAAQRVLAGFAENQPEADVTGLLTAEDFPVLQLLSEELSTLWSVWYVPRAIRSSLSLLIALNPKDEYPEARAMHRHFVLHLGGTNTGKTYIGFQHLLRAKTGIYLAPLRLLALEAQETLIDGGVECGLSTGEESDIRPGDTHMAATAEKLDLKRHYDMAVIDECQMIADPKRGYAWTRAILGVLAPQVHLCAAPEAKDLLLRLIDSCGDSVDVVTHERKTPLVCMSQTIDYERVRPGDALITFSKVGVLSVAEDLRQNGKEPAIIYGALPYATRRKQMEGFLQGSMQYIVSTDAIGMGLNLPIRRVIFMETEKYDGFSRRELKPEEILQIAGRAGRFGMYNRGYVGATQNLGFIRAGLQAVIPPLEYAVVGFSDLVLQVDFDLLEVLTEWNRMPTVEPYRKLDISRYITVISKMREAGLVLSKEQELLAANIPFDETEEPLRDLFFDLLQRRQRGEEIEQPGFPEDDPTLPELELYCRKLDLYYSFAHAFGFPMDEDKLYDSRERAAEEINEILLYRLRSNIRFCDRCGKPLPFNYHKRLCNRCFIQTRKQ